MVCQACGVPVQGAFCSQCGAAVSAQPMYAAPPMYPYSIPEQRVQRNIRALAILWCVFGAYRALSGIVGALFLAGVSTGRIFGVWGSPGGYPFMHNTYMNGSWVAAIVVFVTIVTIIFSGVSFLVGYALLNRKPWGRTLAIVISILQLISIPVGTALSIYTLWVLAPSASGAEYDSIALG